MTYDPEKDCPECYLEDWEEEECEGYDDDELYERIEEQRREE